MMEKKQTNPNNAWWLPAGSIRAVLAAGLVGAVIYLGITGGEIPDILGTLSGVGIAFYFSKSKGV